VRAGRAAEPVCEAWGSPGRPVWSPGAVGDGADTGGAGSSPEHPATPQPTSALSRRALARDDVVTRETFTQ
jgi:hypothetical protein